MPARKPAYEQLVAYAAGELPAAEAAEIEAYLANDPAAAATVARFRLVAATARAHTNEAPPAESVQAAQMLFRERQAQTAPTWRSELKRIVAHLTADKRPAAALAGLRGRSASYQCAFESNLADADLESGAEPGDRPLPRVRGRVSPHGTQTAAAIALALPGTFEPVVAAQPDAHGAFGLSTKAGHFDAFVSPGDAVVVLPNVEVE